MDTSVVVAFVVITCVVVIVVVVRFSVASPTSWTTMSSVVVGARSHCYEEVWDYPCTSTVQLVSTGHLKISKWESFTTWLRSCFKGME